jgi:hypothetical protein
LKEEGCAVSTQETAARRNLDMELLTRLSAPWTSSRPHPRIANQLAGGNQYNVNLRKLQSFDSAERGLSLRGLENVSTRRRSATMRSSHSQLTLNLNRRISDGITDMKNMTSLRVLKRPCNIDRREEENAERQWPGGILELD